MVLFAVAFGNPWPDDAAAAEIDVGNPDVKLRWDNTVEYSTAVRLLGQNPVLLTNINGDDGDRNFNRGIISNRFDVLSEMDLTYKGFGFRTSAAAWYDSIYNQRNDNNSPGTANQLGPYDQFSATTRQLHGRDIEFLDAFVFGSGGVGDDMQGSFRLGRHGLLWGETLFFGSNGIAGGMAPVDAIKALSKPGTPFKEIIRPVNQISGQLQITSTISVGAFYQLQWEHDRLPAPGSYFSTLDNFLEGEDRTFVGANPFGGPPLAFFQGNDISARDSGQGGLELRLRTEDVDYGLYAIRYNDKVPEAYLYPGPLNPATGSVGQLRYVYPESITSVGASFSTTFGAYNVAGEFSGRDNMPFVSPPVVVQPGEAADNDKHALYAVGQSLHGNLSTIAALSPSFIAAESTLTAEVAWNRRIAVTKNRSAMTANSTRDAATLRVIYEPTYRQVLPGLDISFPIGLGYSPLGRSAVVAGFGSNRGGDMSVGLSGSFHDVWRFGMNYVHYYGAAAPTIGTTGDFTFDQALKDRDFISFNVRRTF